MKKRKFVGITRKICLVNVLAGFLIMAGTIIVGYMNFKSSIETRYNDIAYQVATAVQGYFTEEEIKTYADLTQKYNRGLVGKEEIDEVVQSERYQEIHRQIDSLRKSMDANDLFVYCFDQEQLENYDQEVDEAGEWNPIQYIMDSYREEDQQFKLGDSGPVILDFIDSCLMVCKTGERPEDYLIYNGGFGHNISSMQPIIIDGEMVALISVEIPMTTLQSDINSFVCRVILVGSLITVLLLIFTIAYFYRKFVEPINTASSETRAFIENNATISTRLSEIKTKDEIQLLCENILKMEIDIKEYIENITAITAEKERVGAELNVATHIQKSMLPCIFPAFPDRKEIDVYATMDPAKEVGGDFYDFFMVDDTHLAIVMADVSGKGVPAALFMVIGKTLIKDNTVPGRDLGEVFTEVNNLLCESNSEGLFITAFEGVLDIVTGRFTFVNAGHELPFICKKDGKYEPYKVRRALVLAGMEDLKYKAGEMYLEPGDRVFQYTDGVTEATDANNQLYGMDRLEKTLNANLDKQPHELLPAIKADIDEFVGEAPQFDDITMLCLEYRQKQTIEE